jgi:hypothetical protein
MDEADRKRKPKGAHLLLHLSDLLHRKILGFLFPSRNSLRLSAYHHVNDDKIYQSPHLL